jgi:Tol biopolymer transport system component
MRKRVVAGLAAALVLGGAAFWAWPRTPVLPRDLRGALVFVSDRDGVDAVYLRRLPRGEDRRLTFTTEPAREPALSPDGTRVAFTMGGRVGLVSLPAGEVSMLTLGVDWRDSAPSWRPDGKALVVVARGRNADHGELHILGLDAPDGGAVRAPLTESRGLSYDAPRFSPDGTAVVCIREDHVFRISLADGRATRLTGGLRTYRAPRFLPDGRLIALWSQEKQFGLDVMDKDGRNRETLAQGTAFYRSAAPSPDGRYLAAAFSYDLQFHATEALRLRKAEEVRLLDARGAPVGPIARTWRDSSHSPDWGR